MGITLDEIISIYDEDSAHVSGDPGMSILAVRNDTPGSLVDTDGDYSPLQLDANGNLRVVGSATYAYDEDSAHNDGDAGAFVLAVRQDTKASTAGANGDYAALIQDADGDLYVSDTVAQGLLTTIDADTSLLSSAIFAEDSASSGGENMILIGGYRQDANTSPVSADGDFHSFIFNALGELKVSSRLDDVSNSLLVTTVTVDTTAGGVQLSTPLSGRREVTIQNLGSQDIWVKNATGVTAGPAGNGFLIPKGSSANYKWSESVDPYAICATGSSVVKILESAQA